MSSIQESASLELVRPGYGRHVLIVGVVILLAVLWTAAMDRIDAPLITSDSVPATVETSATVTTRVKSVDVPVYYFPSEADRTDTYMTPKEVDCSPATTILPHDYPSGWLSP